MILMTGDRINVYIASTEIGVGTDLSATVVGVEVQPGGTTWLLYTFDGDTAVSATHMSRVLTIITKLEN